MDLTTNIDFKINHLHQEVEVLIYVTIDYKFVSILDTLQGFRELNNKMENLVESFRLSNNTDSCAQYTFILNRTFKS